MIRILHSVTLAHLHEASLVTYELRQGMKSGVPFIGDVEIRVDDREPRDSFVEHICKAVGRVWMS
jgi:hypothetical protein